jgi:hypothetical protein
VKPATRKKVRAATQRIFEEVLGKIPANLAAVRRETKRLRAAKKKDMLRVIRTGVGLGLYSKEFEKILNARREPTARQLQKFLAAMESYDFASVVRAFLKTALLTLRRPGGRGKQPKLNPLQQKEAKSRVALLVGKGRSRRAAYQEVAKRHRVHWRTIQNLCMKGRQKPNPSQEGERNDERYLREAERLGRALPEQR